jgi:anti-sigma regulatory factor (Ser/Thr protein kinase)
VSDAVASRTFGITAGDVALIDDWLEQVGGAWGVDARTMFRVRLCVAELAANAVEHGVPRSGADEMIVTVRRLADGVAVDFRDSRAPFDPTVPPPQRPRADTVATAEPSGRGLLLLHAYARNLAYAHDGTHNQVTMTIPSM